MNNNRVRSDFCKKDIHRTFYARHFKSEKCFEEFKRI